MRKSAKYRIDGARGKLVLGKYELPFPASRGGRIATGSALMVGGVLGFLPILGFWMLPLGLMVLSHDIAPVRRRRRKLILWWARRRANGMRGRG